MSDDKLFSAFEEDGLLSGIKLAVDLPNLTGFSSETLFALECDMRIEEDVTALYAEGQEDAITVVTSIFNNNDGTFTYTSEDGVTTLIDVCAEVDQDIGSIVKNADGTHTHVLEDGTVTHYNAVGEVITPLANNQLTCLSDGLYVPSDSFNIIPSEDLGSYPITERASIEQMRRLMTSEAPELEGIVMMTGVESGDRRRILKGALDDALGMVSSRRLPLPAMFTDVKTERHLESVLGGNFFNLAFEEIDADRKALLGNIKLIESEAGQKIYDQFQQGAFRGISADLTEASFMVSERGSKIDGGEMVVMLQAKFMGATLVPFPALEDAAMWLTEENLIKPNQAEAPGLVASGYDSSYSPELQVITSIFESGESNNV